MTGRDPSTLLRRARALVSGRSAAPRRPSPDHPSSHVDGEPPPVLTTRAQIGQVTAYEGVCAVCGAFGRFERRDRSMRETFPCPACQASLRYRHQAEVLVAHLSRRGSASLDELCAEPEVAALAVYEPGVIGPFRERLGRLDDYVTSAYWPDVETGTEHDGVRCEDLEALTFPDGRFDLLVSSDILEHVRHPDVAFAESFRVLRPGGLHVFTVPFLWPLRPETEVRVDVSGPDDVHLLEPRYHRNPVDPEGALVYNEFGLDLVTRMERVGFQVRLPRGLHHTMTVVARRPDG